MEWCYTYGLRNWHEVLHGNRNALTHPWVLAVLLAMLVFFFFFFSGRCLMMWFLSAWAPVEFFFCVPRASYFHGDDGSWTCGGWLPIQVMLQFFYCHSFGFISKTHTAYCRNAVIVISEESGFGLCTADFETITAQGVFQPSNLTSWTTQGRKKVVIRAMLIQLDKRLLLANVWS